MGTDTNAWHQFIERLPPAFCDQFFRELTLPLFWVKCLQNVKRRMLLSPSQILDEHKLSFLRHWWSFFRSSSKYTKILGKFYFSYLWKMKKYTNSNIQIHKSWITITWRFCGRRRQRTVSEAGNEERNSKCFRECFAVIINIIIVIMM